MDSSDTQKAWEVKIGSELEDISKVLKSIGFSLEKEQPHVIGERFLMTRDKLVLDGTRIKDDLKVIIKISNNKRGKDEILQEKKVKDALSSFTFSRDIVLLPEEIFFGEIDDYLIFITKFIPREQVFASYPLPKQFFTILRIFESEEAFHATTFEHITNVKKILPVFHSKEYLESFEEFRKKIIHVEKDLELSEALLKASKLLHENRRLIDMYCDYLTHTDLVPTNFRIYKQNIYTIDLSSILFGNKYEGWARFINYTVIHSPGLDTALLEYVKKNRGEEEYLCLRLMRIYKTVLLIEYYTRSLERTYGDLHTLTKKRIKLWTYILNQIIKDDPVSKDVIQRYRDERNELRSKEEMERQKEFNIPNL